MKRGVLVFACALALVTILSTSTPAGAVTYGTPDSAHAFVGALILVDADGSIIGYCSGSLISARVFLTAGHCGVEAAAFPLEQFFVTFSADLLTRKAWRTVSAIVVDPRYAANMADPHDVAVVILSKAVRGVTPGNLVPSADYLDQLADSGGLVPHETPFQIVGYGVDQNLVPTFTREATTGAFLSLQPAWLSNSENPALGNGGGCFGDSGGPVIYTSGTAQYIVSVVSSGDMVCRALDKSYRVDTAESLSFILPEVAAYT